MHRNLDQWKFLGKSFPRKTDVSSDEGLRPTFQKRHLCCFRCPIHENTLPIEKITKDWGWKWVAVTIIGFFTSLLGRDHPRSPLEFRKTWKQNLLNVVSITTGRLVWFPPLNLKKFTLRVSTRRARHTTYAAVGGDLLPTHFQHFLANLHLTKNSHVVRWVCQSSDIA